MTQNEKLTPDLRKVKEAFEFYTDKTTTATIHLNTYQISKLDDDQLNISIRGEGEGGTFDLKAFEELVDKFYKENF